MSSESTRAPRDRQPPRPWHWAAALLLQACSTNSFEVPQRWLADEDHPVSSAASGVPAGTTAALTPAAAPLPPRTLAERLARTRLPSFRVRDQVSLRATLAPLAAATGLPLIVTARAEQAALDAGAWFDLDLAHPIGAENLLDLITAMAGDDVAWTIRHDAILLTTKDRVRFGQAWESHDVRTLTARRSDFRAPRIDGLRPVEAFGGSGGATPSPGSWTEDEIVDLVRENVAAGSWDGPEASLEIEGGILFVRHVPQVRAAVRRFLAELGS